MRSTSIFDDTSRHYLIHETRGRSIEVYFDVASWTMHEWNGLDLCRSVIGVNNADPFPRSYAPEVKADASGKWAGNALRFRTEAEAERWVEGLAQRWILVTETRVVESWDEPTYEISDDGVMRYIGEEVPA